MQLIGNLRQSQAKSFKMYDLQRYFKEEMNIRIILLKFPMIMTNYQKNSGANLLIRICVVADHINTNSFMTSFPNLLNTKKQRLANVIIQNLKKSTLPSQGSARNIFSKGGPSLNHNYSQFMKKVKDFKIAEQNIIAQTPSSIQECMPLTRQPSFEQVLDAKQTLTPSYSRNQSPKLLFKPQQFILKSKFKTNNALDKILTEARNQITTSQSPRSVQVSQHKKIKSHPAKVYTEHNRLLQRVILKTKLNQ